MTTTTTAELEAEWQAEELVMLALLDAAHDTLLPELAEVIGKDRLIRFLTLFEGTTIVVPPASKITNAARDATIYRRVEEGDEVGDLAVEFDIDEGDVGKIHGRMGELAASCSPYLVRQQQKRRRRKRTPKVQS